MSRGTSRGPGRSPVLLLKGRGVLGQREQLLRRASVSRLSEQGWGRRVALIHTAAKNGELTRTALGVCGGGGLCLGSVSPGRVSAGREEQREELRLRAAATDLPDAEVPLSGGDGAGKAPGTRLWVIFSPKAFEGLFTTLLICVRWFLIMRAFASTVEYTEGAGKHQKQNSFLFPVSKAGEGCLG